MSVPKLVCSNPNSEGKETPPVELSRILLNKARFPGWANLFNFLVDILSKQFPCFLLY